MEINRTLAALIGTGIALLIIREVFAFVRWVLSRTKNPGSLTTNGLLKKLVDDFKTLATAEAVQALDDKVDKSVIEIVKVKTVVSEQKSQCKVTVDRFDKTISDQNKALLDIAKNRRK